MDGWMEGGMDGWMEGGREGWSEGKSKFSRRASCMHLTHSTQRPSVDSNPLKPVHHTYQSTENKPRCAPCLPSCFFPSSSFSVCESTRGIKYCCPHLQHVCVCVRVCVCVCVCVCV